MNKQTAIDCVLMITVFSSTQLAHTLAEREETVGLRNLRDAAKEAGAKQLAKFFEAHARKKEVAA